MSTPRTVTETLTDCLFTSFTQRVMDLEGAEDICDYAAI